MKAVLIVEDDAIIRSDMQTLLEEEGYGVVTAGSAEEALAKLTQQGPDIAVILLDLGLPDADGAEFRKAQLALPGRSEVPVVLLSGQADLGAMAKRLGVAGFLRKPFRIQALFDIVARYCKARTAEPVT